MIKAGIDYSNCHPFTFIPRIMKVLPVINFDIIFSSCVVIAKHNSFHSRICDYTILLCFFYRLTSPYKQCIRHKRQRLILINHCTIRTMNGNCSLPLALCYNFSSNTFNRFYILFRYRKVGFIDLYIIFLSPFKRLSGQKVFRLINRIIAFFILECKAEFIVIFLREYRK